MSTYERFGRCFTVTSKMTVGNSTLSKGEYYWWNTLYKQSDWPCTFTNKFGLCVQHCKSTLCTCWCVLCPQINLSLVLGSYWLPAALTALFTTQITPLEDDHTVVSSSWVRIHNMFTMTLKWICISESLRAVLNVRLGVDNMVKASLILYHSINMYSD